MLLVCAGAALLRVPGLSTDLWVDELWSLQNALGTDRWQDLLLRTRIDNNHHLNSLYLHFLGAQSSAAVYRLVSFVSGVASVATAWMVGRCQSPLTGVVAAVLFGGSYLIAFYASEARGYATVVWLTLAAWYCVERYLQSPRRGWAVAFAACSLLGVMAHQAFVFFFVGAYVWSDARLQRKGRSLRDASRAVGQLFAAPVVLIGVFYVVALYGQETGGGPPYRLVTVAAQTLSATSGGPLTGGGLWIAGTLVGAAFVVAIWSAGRDRDSRWILYLVAGLVMPVLLVVLRQPTTLSPRYFIVPVSVLLLAAARWLSGMLERGGVARMAAAALLGTHVTAGVLHVTSEASSRGRYSEAVRRIAELGAATVASADRYSGHDFRTRLLVEHYSAALGLGDRIRYVDADEYLEGGADVVIVESLGEPSESSVSDPSGHTFELVEAYPAGDLSGTTWHVYRRASPDDGLGGR